MLFECSPYLPAAAAGIHFVVGDFNEAGSLAVLHLSFVRLCFCLRLVLAR